MTLLMIGSIFMFILSCWNILSDLARAFGDGYYYGSYDLEFWIGRGMEFLVALLLMIGFIMFRGEYLKPISQVSHPTVPPVAAQAQSVSMRFCPKCGRQIPGGTQFCGFCGWQVEGQNK